MQEFSQSSTVSPLQVAHSVRNSISASAAAEFEARTKLAHALQTSLDIKQVLGLFYRHMQHFVQVTGLEYQPANKLQGVLEVGQNATHHCDYRLNTPGEYLGEIIFSRKKRFSESEQLTLETLLASLVFPLRNALKYQEAIKRALLDPLTHIGNREALDNTLTREHQLMHRHTQPFSLLMIDLDNFKRINDQYGHTRGDDVLKAVAETLEEISRATDMTFRYGGEEFALVLSNTDSPGARISAERLRHAIEKISVKHDGIIIQPTASIGVSTCQCSDSIASLIERADQGLYSAKKAGRNRVKFI